MKKLGLLISVLALVLGLSQCKKPNANYYQGGGVFTNEITFTTGGGAKGGFDQVAEVLKYKWNENDVLHVYSGKKVEGKFQGSAYLGELPLVDGKDTYDATFRGTVSGTPASGDNMLRFVHYGTGVNKTLNGDEFTGKVSVDFASQTGVLTDISEKVVAMIEADMVPSGVYNEDLLTQFAVANLKFVHFPGKDITVNGITANQINVSETGDVSFAVKDGAKDEPASVLEDAIGADCYYVVFLPENVSTNHSLISSGKFYNLEKKFEAGIFYSKQKTGEPFECSGKWINGMLPGKFKVNSSGKQVHFAQGNLVYDNKDFYFHENQYDRCFTANGDVSANYTQTGRFDIFGWGTGNIDGVTGRYAQPWEMKSGDSNNPKYGPKFNTNIDHNSEKLMLNDNYAGGTNYANYDWGHNSGKIGEGWYAISNVFFKYVIGYQDEANRGGKRFAKGNVNGINGLIILPDGWVEKEVGDPLYLANINKKGTGFMDNTISVENWEAYEFAGCVFMPNGGCRSGGELKNISDGYYWSRSSSLEGGGEARGIKINSEGLYVQSSFKRSTGCFVRLIHND
ncbi:MAG: hypothetical protein Q4F69_08955 [Bacteroidia bacterium]|nr:hypothetical protein [Bacteroidia bacterium]